MNAPYTHLKADQKRVDEYFSAQWDNPYKSTIAFEKWLSEKNCFSDKGEYADLGCGMGSNVFYFSQQQQHCNFTGIDIDEDLVEQGNSELKKRSVDNGLLSVGDWFNLKKEHQQKYRGIFSAQTLMMFKDHETPLNALMDLDPDWLGINSLFFDGDIECSTLIRDYTYTPAKEYYYSTFSLSRIQSLCEKRGYHYFYYVPFHIDIDLERKADWKGMGTYTARLAQGGNLQISGPLLMNWYFILASKKPMSDQ